MPFFARFGAERNGGIAMLPRQLSALRHGWQTSFALWLVLISTFFFFATPLHADTVTIIDDPDISPPDGTQSVFTDAYIQHHLNVTGTLTIDTANSTIGGPDDILVEPGVAITWTTGSALNLIADANIIISGTIQHNGPASGSGGITLIANHDDTGGGDLRLGASSQPASVAVGSRHGLTTVEATNVILQAGSTDNINYTQLGYAVVNQGTPYSVTGAIMITATRSLTGAAGISQFSYSQIGHGGSVAGNDSNPDGTLAGNITISVTNEINFIGGTSQRESYALLGHGGYRFNGPITGTHSVEAGGSINFQGGSGNDFAFAHLGNGGSGSSGTHGGNLRVVAGEDISFLGGSGLRAHAQIGNGGWSATGNTSGDLHVEAKGEINFRFGFGTQAYTQIGNGGRWANGTLLGVVTVTAADDIVFSGAGEGRPAQIGHGGYQATGNFTGTHTVTAGGSIIFTSGQIGNGGYGADGNFHSDITVFATEHITFLNSSQSYVQIGNGGYGNDTTLGNSGDITVTAQNGDIYFHGGNGLGRYALIGNGSYLTNGAHSGNINVTAGGDLEFIVGEGNWAHAMIGHDGTLETGTLTGDITVEAAGNVHFWGASTSGNGNFAQIGHGGNSFYGPITGTVIITAGQSITFANPPTGDVYLMAGHGGYIGSGTRSGDIHLDAGLDISFIAGAIADEVGFVQVGHGGQESGGNTSGDHTLNAGRNIDFTAGQASYTYAQVGNGGYDANGNHSGNITLRAGEKISFTAGSDLYTYAHAGNGGFDADGEHSGDVRLETAGNVSFAAGNSANSYAHVGNGGGKTTNFTGNLTGTHIITAGGDIHFAAGGIGGYALVGNGGIDAIGDFTDTHTLWAGGTVTFTAGSGDAAYAQVGNGGYSADGNTLGGNHSVTAANGNIYFQGGSGDQAYVQVGNGGRNSRAANFGDLGADGNPTVTAPNGDIVFVGGGNSATYAMIGNGGGYNSRYIGSPRVMAGGHITFTAGPGSDAFVQVGNGGGGVDSRDIGNSGNISMTTQNGDITFVANGPNAYAQVGNGGGNALGPMRGDIALSAGGNVTFRAGADAAAYAQVGNGGNYGDGRGEPYNGHGGNITVTAQGGDITFLAAAGLGAYAHAGNGGIDNLGAHDGAITLTAFDNIIFTASTGEKAYVLAGNGGSDFDANYGLNNGLRGNHTLTAHHGDIRFTAGDGPTAYAQAGNGGSAVYGDHSGNVRVEAAGNVAFVAGSASYSYAQVGNGGSQVSSYTNNLTGTHTIRAGGDIHLAAGSDPQSYVQVGNGAGTNSGTRNGDLTLLAGDNLVVQGARIGHATSAGDAAITDANTYIAVGQNDPLYSGTGVISVTHTPTFTTIFNSAPLTNSGELRFYVPREANVLIAASTPMNSESFPGSVPANRKAGFFLFADSPETHPYIQDYSFYFGLGADLGVTKQIAPSGNLLPGQPITYTLAFTNSGLYTATNVVLTDTLPSGLLDTFATTSALDTGVSITQTSGAPTYAWEVSDLAPGRGGVITITAKLLTGLGAFSTFTNRAGITGTLEMTPANNSQVVTSTLIVPTVNVAPTLYTVLENSGTAMLTVTLNITNPYAMILVPHSTADNTAIMGSDYTAVANTIIFPAGSDTITKTVPILNDRAVEATEQFTFTLGTPLGGVLGANPAVVTILDDDSAVGISTLDADKAEGSGGSTNFTFTVTRTGYLTTTVTVDYAVSGDVDAADFAGNVLPSGILTFAEGESSQPITITVQGDLLAESDEVFAVTLSNPSASASLDNSTANGAIRNDDTAPALTVSKVANVSLARVGETIIYTYRITNSGGLTFTTITAHDDQLGLVTLDKSSLALGDVATGQLTHTVVAGNLPGPLVNTVTVTGTPVVGSDVVATANTSVDLVSVQFAFTKTIGISGIEPECTAASTMQVPISTTVIYCFTITNTGSEPLTTHTLTDDHLGTLLDDTAQSVAPGASYSLAVARTLYVSTTNTAVWTARYAGSDAQADTVSIAALPAQNTTQATVIISDDTDDQDGDGIPDNLEQAGDVDNDNVPSFLDDDSDGDERLDVDECPGLPCRDSDADGTPDFLDPNDATALDPDEQPMQRSTLFLPSVAGD